MEKPASHANLEIPAGDGESENAQVGMRQTADLGILIEGLGSMTKAMATICRMPKH
jgi:hypothetical protein